ncbi:glycoside hydrolase family 15 protein [Gayadomonas joobiniege]|uniref:glycoside hydrolase family 15 protein n=1 Tax=Gayadomonas joobiniege TaxID=1234606 RepID=UPI000367291C|nr:glycoside hydrolase family 15 protein [Gayadomonas joobiniege]
MKKSNLFKVSLLSAALLACQSPVEQKIQTEIAPGAPGDKPFWAYSGKQGIGTSYEAYQNGQYNDHAKTGKVSKVWFSLAKGMITETMFGLIHQAQIKDMQFIVVGDEFVVAEQDGLEHEIEYLHTDDSGRPLSLAYKIISRDKKGRFTLEKHVFTDPESQSLFVRAIFKSQQKGLKAYVQVNPYVNNNGIGDRAFVKGQRLIAADGDNFLTLQSKQGFAHQGVGYIGQSDLITQLKSDKQPVFYRSTGAQSGNVAMAAELGDIGQRSEFDLVLSFAKTPASSAAEGQQALARGYQRVLNDYAGKGDYYGWSDYLNDLSPLKRMYAQTADQGDLLNVSAMVLKAQEDKTHAGALIASLSNPWGDTVPALEGHTGYKAVWVRDFYQVAMAFLAMGDKATAKTAFEYLEKVQVTDKTPGNRGDTGWFLQKTHVDGELEWVAVQMDQTAMPIMLALKLYQADVLSSEELSYWYHKMLKPAAQFLVKGGKASILWNDTQIEPPFTQQERWEEQSGYSPSTMAAIVGGLVSAAKIAQLSQDTVAAELYLNKAKEYNKQIEALTFTQNGQLKSADSDGQYYFRINPGQGKNQLKDNNGRAGLEKSLILDGGFLELARYGVRAANDPHILSSLPEYEDESIEENLRVKYTFTNAQGQKYPGYRRYGNDGYGELTKDGGNYAHSGTNHASQRGRVWPFFTGERGHYEIAKAKQNKTLDTSKKQQIKQTYVFGMEQFANQGLMLPEQVWDGVGEKPDGYQTGQGTNSATPLAWTHAEYVKLVRSLSEGQVWDYYPEVRATLAGDQ